MTDILRHRVALFQALYALLIRNTYTKFVIYHDIPDHLSQDLGLPFGTPPVRLTSHLGIMINAATP